ncbi:winged helix DNA-binding domain-containing protein [Pseudonocardia xinjiangensis]|uniref:winged helix DNA-binding domain-containing protein n=1 Tax=Pseudonocardia xinjiangensis TaxID=75289 RepID=UPI003D901355
MTGELRIGTAQRRARLGRRHRLAPGHAAPDSVAGVVGVADALVALHATDPASVVLAVLARSDAAAPTVERALHDERALVRMLSMRRTVWVTALDVAPVLQAACTLDVAAVQRRKLVQHLERAGVAEDPAVWLADVEASALRALVARGEATAVELVTDEPRLRTRIVVPPDDTPQNMTSRALLVLAADGHIARGRPLGGWTSTQYRWSPTSAWWPGGMPELDPAAAHAELARRWLTAFGPAPVADLKWWTGWTMARTRAALTAVGAVAVDLDGVPGVVLPDDVEPVAQPEPWVALLPGLDPTAMGWQDRGWYLGPHKAALFDRSGNIGPTVWSDGRIVGGWAQRADGTVALRLLEDIGTEATTAVHATAERLSARIGDVRVTPRFRTPLERELTTLP